MTSIRIAAALLGRDTLHEILSNEKKLFQRAHALSMLQAFR